MSGTLWVITGATGTGKTQLSLELAEARMRAGKNVEIVNADAMQFYRGMDIGTAKLPVAERRSIPHALFDALDVREEATVAWYQPVARAHIHALLMSGADVVLVGGSGLYVSSVVYDFRFPPRDATIRAALEEELARDGVDALYLRLHRLDPETATAIDGRNARRVVRALELHALGEAAHAVLPERPVLWHEHTRVIGVRTERATLVPRLDRRVEQMWASGLLEEVRALLPAGIAEGPTASRAIGYAQAIAQLHGQLTQDEAIAETQALTRRYARRQVSWFKRYPEIEWIDRPEARLILDESATPPAPRP